MDVFLIHKENCIIGDEDPHTSDFQYDDCMGGLSLFLNKTNSQSQR